MELYSKTPLFVRSLVLLSALGFPFSVLRPENWGFPASVLLRTSCEDVCVWYRWEGNLGEKEGFVLPFLRSQLLQQERQSPLAQC